MEINWNLDKKTSTYLDTLIKEYKLPEDFKKFIVINDDTTEKNVRDKVVSLHKMLKAYAITYVEKDRSNRPVGGDIVGEILDKNKINGVF